MEKVKEKADIQNLVQIRKTEKKMELIGRWRG